MFKQELSDLEKRHLLRRQIVVESYDGPRVTISGRSMLLMCSNDYLGLSGHPALREAAAKAMEHYGFGSGASRLISGTSALHMELESRIAAFKGTESALLFNSGYAANTGIIPAIAGEGHVILSDSLNHASIIDGCRLSKAKVVLYPHKDVDRVESGLKKNKNAKRTLIVTDGVFSMDGDIAPLADLVMLAEKYGAIIMVDDAHATGVIGKTGRGTSEHFGLSGRVHIQMGTLGKAHGSFGAYAAGSRDFAQYLMNTARSFIYSTALPPSVCAASLAAFDIMDRNPELRKTLWNNRDRFVRGLAALGLDTGDSETPIIPVMLGESEKAMKAADMLFEYGLYAAAVRPPSVPEGAARIRVTVTAAHSSDDIDTAVALFGRLKQEGYL
ncbi:MAG TPA: 8-amino-7-oxononanoate synthase [Nitrospirota bacterium]|nr:8-amino-7-oxononanoate synthase [Nitrospirota bacterium]